MLLPHSRKPHPPPARIRPAQPQASGQLAVQAAAMLLVFRPVKWSDSNEACGLGFFGNGFCPGTARGSPATFGGDLRRQPAGDLLWQPGRDPGNGPTRTPFRGDSRPSSARQGAAPPPGTAPLLFYRGERAGKFGRPAAPNEHATFVATCGR